jgi:hypothetical protein
MTQVRKTKPEVVAEIDALLNEHGDREVAEILNQRGHRTWQNQLFTLDPYPAQNAALWTPIFTFSTVNTVPKCALFLDGAPSIA